MKIRKLTRNDIPRLQEIYGRMGIPLPFPDLEEFLPISAVVDEEDRVVAAVGCLPAVEVYMFIDKDWETPGMRYEAFRQLHEDVRKDLLNRGVVEAHAFVPPDRAKIFSRRLKALGWIRSYWPCFSRRADHV